MLISLFGSDYYSDNIEIKKSETLPQAEECQHTLFIKNQIKKFSIGKKFERKLNGNIEEREISLKKLRQSQQACFVQRSVATPMNKLSVSSTSEFVISPLKKDKLVHSDKDKKRQTKINEFRSELEYDILFICKFIERIDQEIGTSLQRTAFKDALSSKRGQLRKALKILTSIDHSFKKCYFEISDASFIAKELIKRRKLNEQYVMCIESFRLKAKDNKYCKKRHSINETCLVCMPSDLKGKYSQHLSFDIFGEQF